MEVIKIKTPKLNLAYEDAGPPSGELLLLVHGWPDSPRTWDKVLPALHSAGFRTVVPYLRGYGYSTFDDPIFGPSISRTGQPVAFAQDMIDLADSLGISHFHFVGHDWGARTGYVLSALFAERVKSHIAISVPFEPGPAQPPKFPQDRAFWYQWLLCTIPGEKKFKSDPVAFGREQWDSWSPSGWYREEDFQAAAASWKGEDFPDIVIHGYRSRWGHAALDKDYAEMQEKFEITQTIGVPTLLIHGEEDMCELLQTTGGAERHFSSSYSRRVIPGVGHFPQREDPVACAEAILKHLVAPIIPL